MFVPKQPRPIRVTFEEKTVLFDMSDNSKIELPRDENHKPLYTWMLMQMIIQGEKAEQEAKEKESQE